MNIILLTSNLHIA